MFSPKMRVLTIVCCFAVAALAMPAWSAADVFGCQSCAAPLVVSPTYTAYMPTPVYRALYQPAVVTAYRPWGGWGAYNGYAVTTYRPVFGWPRLVPYTTYRPVYAAMPVISYAACNPCVSCSPCDSGGCGAATYAAPTSGCASCAPAIDAGSGATPPQKTFQEKVEKPATETDLKPIPQTETQLNSTPAPQLLDPNDRTAARTVRTSARVELTASANPALPARNDGWRPARD